MNGVQLPTWQELLDLWGLNTAPLTAYVHPGYKTVRSSKNGFTPLAVMLHHTGPYFTEKGIRQHHINTAACQFDIGTAGDTCMISDGRTRHPGKGSSAVLTDIRQGRPVAGDARDLGRRSDTDGYRWFWGIEVMNPGDGTPFTQPQLEATYRLSAGLCILHGWDPAVNVLHHREWTSRKIDMHPAAEPFGASAQRWTAHYVDVIKREMAEIRELVPPDPEEVEPGDDGGRTPEPADPPPPPPPAAPTIRSRVVRARDLLNGVVDELENQ